MLEASTGKLRNDHNNITHMHRNSNLMRLNEIELKNIQIYPHELDVFALFVAFVSKRDARFISFFEISANCTDAE
jgi:hypothetical protein